MHVYCSQEKMALMAFLLFPFELVYPVIVGRWQQHASQPLEPFLVGYPFRQGITLFGALLVYSMPVAMVAMNQQGSNLSPTDPSTLTTPLDWWFYARVLGLQIVYSLA